MEVRIKKNVITFNKGETIHIGDVLIQARQYNESLFVNRGNGYETEYDWFGITKSCDTVRYLDIGSEIYLYYWETQNRVKMINLDQEVFDILSKPLLHGIDNILYVGIYGMLPNEDDLSLIDELASDEDQECMYRFINDACVPARFAVYCQTIDLVYYLHNGKLCKTYKRDNLHDYVTLKMWYEYFVYSQNHEYTLCMKELDY